MKMKISFLIVNDIDLQMVRSAARVVINACKSDRLRMTEVRKNLHWLPINARIEYNILMLTWKAYHETGPKYLSDLLYKNNIYHDIRSVDDSLLIIPKINKVSCCDRAFQKVAPLLWDNIPVDMQVTENVNSFKHNLKTHSFSKYYKTTGLS